MFAAYIVDRQGGGMDRALTMPVSECHFWQAYQDEMVRQKLAAQEARNG